MRVALVKQGIIFGFAEIDGQGNLTPHQEIPSGLSISSLSVEVTPEPQLGYIEGELGWSSPSIDFEEAKEVASIDPSLDLIGLLKGTVQPSFCYLKKNIIDAIDVKTGEILSRGFEFDGHSFSLSIEAQKNWLFLYVQLVTGHLTSNTELSTKENTAYVLTPANAPAFLTAGTTKVSLTLKGGRDLKASVTASESLEFLKSFMDGRE
jgi:hypothetical protein